MQKAANTAYYEDAKIDFHSIVFNDIWTEWDMIASGCSRRYPLPKMPHYFNEDGTTH